MVYAEPATRIPLRIEVLPPEFAEPDPVRQRDASVFKPAAPGAIVRMPPRSTPAARNAPPIQAENIRQANLPASQQTIDVEARTVSVERPATGRPVTSSVPRTRTRAPDISAEIDEGSAYGVAGLGFGVFDELRNVPREEAFRTNAALDYYEFYSGYEVGRSAASFGRDVFEDIKDVRLPRIDLPDFRMPNVTLPDVRFPTFDLPDFKLPEITLPKIDIPSLHWPDFNLPDLDPSDPARDSHRETEETRERERERIRDRRDRATRPSPTAEDELPDLIRRIPENCHVVVFLATHYRRTYSQRWVEPEDPSLISTFFGYFNETTPSTNSDYIPGAGAVPNLITYDSYGNKRLWYQNDAAGFGGDGYNIYLENGTYPPDASNTINIYRLADQRINRDFNLDALKAKLPLPLNLWEVVGKQMTCYGGRGGLLDNPPEPPPPAPPPPIPPDNRKPSDMACCTCAQIAVIVQSSLRTLKQAVTVPVVSCELREGVWTPVITSTTVELFAIDSATAASYGGLYLQMAQQAISLCEAKNIAQRLATVVGVDEFPVSVPQTLTTPEGEDPPDENNLQLENLTQFFGWFVERFDEVMGHFEIAIKIQDTDLEAEGEQSQILKFPNVAETLAEMIGLLMKLSSETEVLISMGLKNLVETGQDKQQNFKSYMLLKAITDYLAFKYKERTHEIPMMFTPNQEELSDVLKESKVKVIAVEYDDNFNYQKTLLKLLEGAAITKAVHWRKIDPNIDTTAQIKTLFEELLKIKNQMSEGKKDASGKDDFDKFIEATEIGFTTEPGIADATHPYGEDFSIRPRIKKLGGSSTP